MRCCWNCSLPMVRERCCADDALAVRLMRRIAVLFALVLLGAAFWPQSARAAWRACNETGYILEMAVATLSELGPISQGWFVVVPGECRAILRAELQADLELFAYARSTDIHGVEGIDFAGDTPFCIDVGDFLIEGAGLCRMRDFNHARFARIAFEGEDWTTYFSEERGYDKERAMVAGRQRLLKRLGYAVGAVDGIEGARTRLALDAFRKEQGIAGEEADLFHAMSAALLARREETGLHVCNRSEHRIWAAVGIGADESGEVESRGWLSARPGDCIVMLPEILEDRAYYLFAEAVDENGFAIRDDENTGVWGGEHFLCVSAIRFAIDRQGECDARNLDQRGFYSVETGGAPRVVEILE